MGMGMATDTARSRCGALPLAVASFAVLQALTATAQELSGYPAANAPTAAPSKVPTAEAGAASETAQPGDEESARRPPRLRRWQIVPRILWSETYSDNVARTDAATAFSGWVTRLTPGITLQGAGPRVQAYFDYQRHEYNYAGHPELDSGENYLDSFATVEALEDWLFVDGRARIVQVNATPFGPSATDTPGFNPNRTETSVVQISPHVRGVLADRVLYQLRFSAVGSHASGNVVPDTTSRQWLGRIQNAPGAYVFGWAMDGSHLVVRNATIDQQHDSRVRASLMYAPHWTVRIAAYGGVEVTDLRGASERTGTPGVGVDWSPSGRTQFAAVAEQRFFGTGHNVLFTHRTQRMALRYVDDKDVSTLPGRLATGGPSSVYNLMADLLAASVPDPTMRADAVRARLERTGAAQYAPGSTGFLTTQATLLARHELSLAIMGRTNTVTLIGNRSEQQALSPVSVPVDQAIATSGIRQYGVSVSWAHQLSPLSAITLSAVNSHSADVASGIGSRQRGVQLALLRSVGRRTSLSLGARRIKFDSEVATPPSFVENAALFNAGMHF